MWRLLALSSSKATIYNIKKKSNGVDYRSTMSTNLYGPGENYYPENSHVILVLIRPFPAAKLNNVPSFAIWGTGTQCYRLDTL